MRQLLLACLLILPTSAFAQAPTAVEYDAPPATTIADNQSWTPVLYVNGTAFVLPKPTCTGASPIVCSAPVPNYSAALTASGAQTFQVALRDDVLGEGAKSLPLSKTKPGASSPPRFR